MAERNEQELRIVMNITTGQLGNIQFLEGLNLRLAFYMESPTLSKEFRNAINVAMEKSRLQGRLEALAYVVGGDQLETTEIVKFISDPKIFPQNPATLPGDEAYELLKGESLPRVGY